jgi:hypothetical protein
MVANHIVMVEVTSVAPFSVYLIECKAGSPHVQRAATKNAQGAGRLETDGGTRVQHRRRPEEGPIVTSALAYWLNLSLAIKL